ncbi:MAG: helix-turn-helix transcriptional regulator [Bdellovibrionaceae bacterium]|nr:helix-turn-helix transcriptional regulator [Pseudobdellovibrionaceae bacterium]
MTNMTLEIFLKAIGQRIAAFRRKEGLLQKDAADQSGVSYRYYQNIETGRANITMGTLFKLARFYRRHPTDLLPSNVNDTTVVK